MIKRITGNIFYTLRVSVSQDCLSLFYSQEKLLQQLRARKVKLQQSKSERIIQLMSDGGRRTTTTDRPHHRLDPQHLEAPRGSASPLTDSSLDQLLARLESLEVRDCVTVWSTLIGRAPRLLRSHWSRASLVMLAPAVLCHKEPPTRGFGTQNIPIGVLLAPRWFFMA